MASNKQSVEQFLDSISNKERQEDSKILVKLIHDITGQEPALWGSSIIGFGTYHYKYESGREGESVIIGFSPRKQAIVLYGVIFYDKDKVNLKKLGNVTMGKGCLYIKRLSEIDISVLKVMIDEAYKLKTSNISKNTLTC